MRRYVNTFAFKQMKFSSNLKIASTAQNIYRTECAFVPAGGFAHILEKIKVAIFFYVSILSFVH